MAYTVFLVRCTSPRREAKVDLGLGHFYVNSERGNSEDDRILTVGSSKWHWETRPVRTARDGRAQAERTGR